ARPTIDLPSSTTRALAITNFVRPLTVNQVKRMLSEFGEIEVLWMDSIRTHCYVTPSICTVAKSIRIQTMIDPNTLKVTELKAELTARGLSSKGLKKELVTRLEGALAAEGASKAPAEEASEPDVAPKESKDEEGSDHGNDHDNGGDNEGDEMDATGELALSESTVSEAKEIAKVVEPVAEPVIDSAEADVVMDPVPIPTSEENVTAKPPTALKPADETPTLVQEGLIDTTMEPPATETAATDSQTLSRKHPLEIDESPSQGESTTDSVSKASDTPAKKLKVAETDRQESEKIAAAAKESMDARRRSSAPSPSPAPGSSISMTPVSMVTSVAKEASSSSTPSAPVSPTSARSPSAGRKVDMRSLMERQIKLAAMDRQPEADSKPAVVSPTTSKALVTKDPEPSE
ncbi:hypothetical protein BGZ80_007685, partial [Entomortierella chlamydospora]